MLVLTRKLDESINIGSDIKITILRVKGNTIRIGIEAPRDVRVLRSELNSAITKGESESETVKCQSELSATVTAIVDSPTCAGPRLFVGKTKTSTIIGNSRITGLPLGLSLNEVAPASMLPPSPIAPLSGFVRSSHNLTAV